YSRSAAEVMARLTGTEYFPGGMGTFVAPANAFLAFERGPSQTVTMQWATYYDAADEAGFSRLYGGIHPRDDDFAARAHGATVGVAAFNKARNLYTGYTTCTTLGDVNGDTYVDGGDIPGYVRAKLGWPPLQGENQRCADYGTGSASGDTAMFVSALLQ